MIYFTCLDTSKKGFLHSVGMTKGRNTYLPRHKWHPHFDKLSASLEEGESSQYPPLEGVGGGGNL